MTMPPPATGRPAASAPSFLREDGTLKSADEMQAEINDRVREAQLRAEQLRAEIAATSAEGVSSNQAATVIVAPGGGLQSIRLNDRVRSMPPAMIAAAVMEAYGKASRVAAEMTLEITARHGDARVVEMVRDIMPPPPPDPNEDTTRGVR